MNTTTLNRVPLFSHLTRSEQDELTAQMHERHFGQGSVIFREGEPGEAAYFVCRGRVKIFRVSPDGREQIVDVFGPGEPFGLVTAIDGRPYPATAQAMEESRVWAIHSGYLGRLVATHPGLFSSVLQEVGTRLRRAHERIHSLTLRSVHQRLAEYLLELAEQSGTPAKSGGTRITLTMTHQELGCYLGASRETVTRALADLRRDGSVEATGADSLVVYKDRLDEWLNG